MSPSDPRRPERVFWREGSPESGMVPVFGDPSRQKTRSGRRRSGDERGAGDEPGAENVITALFNVTKSLAKPNGTSCLQRRIPVNFFPIGEH
ncbi:hypothetical protein Lsha_1156 [Legionella shakespearei DSM 23087]|uniref:Uncharacterized protein n=1 Tax=Legionella shakespearei DSM 23087 TaxID=1122169 RepID=A0A0W0Z013_9GAMM|nr:hypothetical protein Lsha_1156 [Legionella shakespearei DSM 23087]